MGKSIDISRLFDKDELSDLTIVFDGGKRALKAHRFILCITSDYFKRMLGPTGQFSEAKAESVELKEDDPEALQALFKWLYTSTYGPVSDDSQEEAAELDTWVQDVAKLYSFDEKDAQLLKFHVNVYIVADKYGVEDLKTEALSCFIAKLQACPLSLLVQKIGERLQAGCAWPAQIIHVIEEQRNLKIMELMVDDGYRELMHEHMSLAVTTLDEVRSTYEKPLDELRQNTTLYKEETLQVCFRCKDNLASGSKPSTQRCDICQYNRDRLQKYVHGKKSRVGG